MQISKTIVINCAGMGARLGFGHTKALLEIGGKPLILHHLDQVSEFEDVRIVVGFDAPELIKTVLKYRKNVVFVFNHEYKSTGTLGSLVLGAQHAREYIVSIDGDLLVKTNDMKKFLSFNDEVVGYCTTYSDDPVCVDISKENQNYFATRFTRERGKYEWTGLVQIKKSALKKGKEHVYHTLEDKLPIRALKIDCREIDTPRDLIDAMRWARKKIK